MLIGKPFLAGFLVPGGMGRSQHSEQALQTEAGMRCNGLKGVHCDVLGTNMTGA